MRPFRALRNLLSPSMVVALLSLSVAMGGTAYAAIVITGTNVKDGTLRSADIADGLYGVQSRDVKNGSLGTIDLSSAARAALKGNVGATGATGATGPADGPAGGSLAGTFPNPTLSADSVGASQVVNDSITGSDVNESTLAKVPAAADADTLGGRNSNAFIRSEGAFLGGQSLSATPMVASVTLTAPSNGRVTLTGTCFFKAGATELYARVRLKKTVVGGSLFQTYDTNVPIGKSLTSTAVYQYAATGGVTNTYSFEVSDIDGDIDGLCNAGMLTLMFVPFRADGTAY